MDSRNRRRYQKLACKSLRALIPLERGYGQLHSIITKPHIDHANQAEISSTAHPTEHITSDDEDKKLLYLQAVIKEGARICPRAAGLLSKKPPPQGIPSTVSSSRAALTSVNMHGAYNEVELVEMKDSWKLKVQSCRRWRVV